jgi:hypothetical protein
MPIGLDFSNVNLRGRKIMKKCEICGTPIIAHKNLVWPIVLTDSYKCPNCGSEYTFKDNPLHYILLIGLFYLCGFALYYSLKYELVKQIVMVTFGIYICTFTHLFLRTHMVFTKARLKSTDVEVKKKLIDQTGKWD